MNPRYPRHKVLLKDIAEKTGFSINTVSHALHNLDDVKPQTKAIIQKAASELGYIGNASARYLRSGRSYTIAIIIGDVSNPHFSLIVKQIDVLLRERHYISLVLNTDENTALERAAIQTAVRQNVDGILLCPTGGGEENIAFLQSLQIPFVLIGRRLRRPHLSYVVCDDAKSGYLLASYLLKQGHRRILFLNGPLEISSAAERLEGYRRAMREHAADSADGCVHTIPIIAAGSDPLIRDALTTHAGCTAVIAFSDILAMRTAYCLRQIDPVRAGQVVLAGFDNIQESFPLNLPLISVGAVNAALSAKSVELLFQLLDTPEKAPLQAVLDTQLVIYP